MKFLADVNASGTLARWLLQQNHDVVKVSEKNPRMTDEEILSWALSENRIILTTDKDFEEMTWRQGKQHRGVLRLKTCLAEKGWNLSAMHWIATAMI